MAGGVHVPPPGIRLNPLSPAPHPQTGWALELYFRYWVTQTGQTLREVAGRVEWVRKVHPDQPISQFENEVLHIIEGQR